MALRAEEVRSQRPSLLGRLRGRGMLVVGRDAAGELVEAKGWWRPESDRLGRIELRRRLGPGKPVVYQGPILDRSVGRVVLDEVSIEVIVVDVVDGDGQVPVVEFVSQNL